MAESSPKPEASPVAAGGASTPVAADSNTKSHRKHYTRKSIVDMSVRSESSNRRGKTLPADLTLCMSCIVIQNDEKVAKVQART